MKRLTSFKEIATCVNPNVATVCSIVISQAAAWLGFLGIGRINEPSFIFILALVAFGLASIYLTTLLALLKRAVAWHVALSLINTFSLLVAYFAILYFNFGTDGNFNGPLSRVDAIYFSLGTLTTAGTGSITAQSQLARGLVSIQMLVDFVFVAVTVVIAIARLGERWVK